MSDSLTSWTVTYQAPPSSTIFRSMLKFRSIESMMLSNHLILRHLFLLLPSIFPSIKVSSNESVFRIRWPKYWSFSFSISPSNEYSGLIPQGKPKNTGMGSLSLLQGIFPTQGLNPSLPHCRRILYQLSHKGSRNLEGKINEF